MRVLFTSPNASPAQDDWQTLGHCGSRTPSPLRPFGPGHEGHEGKAEGHEEQRKRLGVNHSRPPQSLGPETSTACERFPQFFVVPVVLRVLRLFLRSLRDPGQRPANALESPYRLDGTQDHRNGHLTIWTGQRNSSTFDYGNHISTSITMARSTGNIRERAFAF
jgi:hypothetical protein